MNIESELKTLFDTGFQRIKENFYTNNKIEEFEVDTHPSILAFRDMIESLPPSIQIIELVGPANHETLNDGKGFLIKYDFNHVKSNNVEYCGSVDSKSPEKLASLILMKFHIENQERYSNDLCTEFNISTWDSDHFWYLQFLPFDILKKPNLLYDELERFYLAFPDIPIIHTKFKIKFHEKYNEVYNLVTDRILTMEDLVKPSVASSMLGITIENIQKSVTELQLIPNVPEDVKRTFERAKNLFIYGYFKYEFFTIAKHYAAMALEAAIKTCYIRTFGVPAVLTDSKNEKLKHEIANPVFYDIIDFCENNASWDVHRLLINGKPMKLAVNAIIDELQDKHLIRKWEKEYYKINIEMRNYLSHPEKSQTHLPSVSILQHIVDEINYLFHALRS